MMKIKNTYKQSWNYLKESKVYFWIAAGLFLISAVIGFLFPIFFVELIENLIKELAERTAGMNVYQLMLFIFQNNITSAFFGMLLGVALGIFPLFAVFFNGYVIGFISGRVVDVAGYSVLLRLLPHGVFEIPALIISLGLGIKLGTSLFKQDFKEIKKALWYNIENSLRVFVFIVVPLLIIAAIIEAGLMLWLS